jgi:hypothetical protein
MVTTEILQSLGYSSIEEYFERLYTENVNSAVYDLMFNEMSEQQQAEYQVFATAHYYEYHDNKDNDNIVPANQRFSSITAEVHEYEVCFYWLDMNGWDSMFNITDWVNGSEYRRSYAVESQQEAERIISDKQFLNNYIK